MDKKQILNIARKEFSYFFYMPMAYIALFAFILATALFFFVIPFKITQPPIYPFFILGQSSIEGLIRLLPYLFTLFIPAVTMRAFSEEFDTGTYEMLATLPIRTSELVLGKFLASFLLTMVMIATTLFIPFTVMLVGTPDWGAVFCGYLGALFLAAMFASIGIFASSLTKNQITAFIIAVAICALFALFYDAMFFLPTAILTVVRYFSANYHVNNFARGLIDLRDIVYMLSVTVVFLFMTYYRLEIKLKSKN
ncbi:MAG TPA: ABC transporter permease subunit [Spirochaetota bacterium]|nr:ABC transporter permease subunit [Spirochaetota bacterium]